MSHDIKSAQRSDPEKVLTDIADYALSYQIKSDTAYETAYYCLMDTLACGFQALKYPACTKLRTAQRHTGFYRPRTMLASGPKSTHSCEP